MKHGSAPLQVSHPVVIRLAGNSLQVRIFLRMEGRNTRHYRGTCVLSQKMGSSALSYKMALLALLSFRLHHF